MRIAFDTRWIRTSNLEGIGGYALELLDQLLKIDDSNDYLLFFEAEERLKYFKTKFEPQRFKNVELKLTNLSLASLSANIISLPRFLRNNKIDIYHVPYFAFAPFKAQYKLIATIYDLVPLLYPRYSVRDCPLLRYIFQNRSVAKFVISKTDRFIVSSKHILDYMSREFSFSGSKMNLVYPGISNKFKPIEDEEELGTVAGKYGLPRDYILFMGELGLHKKITNLIKAYFMISPGLRKKHKLVIIGRGEKLYPRDVDSIMKKGKIHQDIVMPGFIHIDDKPAIYSMAKAFISPTLYEGFPLFILEAMACGVPVAASDIPHLHEFVEDSILKFDPARPESMSIAMERILCDESLRSDLTGKGRVVAAKFSWEDAARKILDVYKEVIEKGG